MTTIVIADDHNIVRKGIRALLEMQADFSVVGEAADGLEAAEIVERLRPDVLVCDFMMPGINGVEVTRRTAQASPDTRVVIFSMLRAPAYVKDALEAGAHAYVFKGAGADELEKAIQAILLGRRYVNAPFSEWIVEGETAGTGFKSTYARLTVRERDTLRLIAEGLSASEIGACLGCGSRTVDTHRRNMMHKLGIDTLAELVRYGVLHGGEESLKMDPRPS